MALISYPSQPFWPLASLVWYRGHWLHRNVWSCFRVVPSCSLHLRFYWFPSLQLSQSDRASILEDILILLSHQKRSDALALLKDSHCLLGISFWGSIFVPLHRCDRVCRKLDGHPRSKRQRWSSSTCISSQWIHCHASCTYPRRSLASLSYTSCRVDLPSSDFLPIAWPACSLAFRQSKTLSTWSIRRKCSFALRTQPVDRNKCRLLSQPDLLYHTLPL